MLRWGKRPFRMVKRADMAAANILIAAASKLFYPFADQLDTFLVCQ